jgi:hypothetical protein
VGSFTAGVDVVGTGACPNAGDDAIAVAAVAASTAGASRTARRRAGLDRTCAPGTGMMDKTYPGQRRPIRARVQRVRLPPSRTTVGQMRDQVRAPGVAERLQGDPAAAVEQPLAGTEASTLATEAPTP